MPATVVDRRADGVALITFNRPESLNIIGVEFVSLFEQALDECAHKEAVRCVVPTGAGRACCAGADVKGMANSAGGFGKARAEPGYNEQVERVRALQNHPTVLIYNMPKPTVALLNGLPRAADSPSCSRATFASPPRAPRSPPTTDSALRTSGE